MEPVVDWLMEGDPAIRWQVLRDLLNAPEQEWMAERLRIPAEGWGAQFLMHQDANGGWGGGVYSPKWVSTTYTLLTLCSLGMPPENEAARRGAHQVIDKMLGETCDARFQKNLLECDRCVVGMILQIAVCYGIADERIEAVADNLLDERMPDGGWNCRRLRRPRPHHSSFHTTINVLNGVREYLEKRTPARYADLLAAEQSALEFMLEHRLYRSDKTGEVIEPRFIMLSFPYRWHYDVLRGLEYFARAGAPHDPRLQDAIDLLIRRQRTDGRWPVQEKHAGRTFFDMERTGAASRWNTLRALRVLRWWQNEYHPPVSLPHGNLQA